MTVKELISELEKIDSSSIVLLEGCDCIGNASGIKTYEGENSCTIMRGDYLNAKEN